MSSQVLKPQMDTDKHRLPTGKEKRGKSKGSRGLRLPSSSAIALFAACFIAAALPSPVAAEARVECGAVRSATLGRPVKYCAILPPSFDVDKARTYPILYWLHGLGENEQSFVDFGGWNLVEELQEKKRIGSFAFLRESESRGAG